MTDITELAPAIKAAADPISNGYSRNWIVSHDDETCWVGANDDDGSLTPFIEVSIADWSGNKTDNEKLARFIALCRPCNILSLIEALEKSEKTSEARREAIDRTHNMFIRERDRANTAEEELATAQKSNEFLKGQLSELANFNPDWDKLEASYDSWGEIAAELLAAKNLIAELESFRTAYMEWSDKTAWVQSDKRFDVLKPWGKHRADVLKAYIEQLESRTVKLPNSNDERFWGYGSEFEVKLYDSCVFYALTAAGIKWEVE